MKTNVILCLIGAILTFGACKEDSPVTDPVEWDQTAYVLEYGDLPAPSIAEDNPLTVQGVNLGRMLFYEKMLSKDNSQSCATCHMQEFAFSDTAKFSIGVREMEGKRQAMAVFNMAWNTNEFFWDGRAHLVRDQSLLPIQDELEMDETLEGVIAKLEDSQTYRDQFKRAFGSEEITSERMSLAMEQFMNSIVSYQSRYDKFLKDSTVFTTSEKRGRDLFFLEYNEFFPNESGADCAHCHGGPNFENDKYMNNGLDEDADFTDLGRFEVTKQPRHRAAFKVPSLRNVEMTFPYMHDGRFATLEEVIDHYDSGIHPSSSLDPALELTRNTGLRLTAQDKTDLINFLKTLTDENLLTNPDYASPF